MKRAQASIELMLALAAIAAFCGVFVAVSSRFEEGAGSAWAKRLDLLKEESGCAILESISNNGRGNLAYSAGRALDWRTCVSEVRETEMRE